MDEITTLENPLIEGGIGPSAFREPDRSRSNDTLADMVVVSADSHFEMSADIFYENFPAHLKDRAPRVWFDKWWRIGKREAGVEIYNAALGDEFIQRVVTQHSNSGLYDRDLRREQIAIEGVQKEIAFPQSVQMLYGSPDFDVREWSFRLYNDYIAEQSALDPDSFYGVGVCSNWWDPNKARESIGQIQSLGLKTYLLPNNPGKYPSGREIAWGDPELEPFWDAVEEAGLPACFHIAENTMNIIGRGRYGAWILSILEAFRKPFGQMVFGGVFDRNPGLKIVFAEGGLAWVPPVLQDAEMIFDSFGGLLEPRPKHRPSYYWSNNCYATFQNDRLGLEQLKYIGVDNVMWGSDYPHTEGAFGYSNRSRQRVLDLTSPKDARKILGGTAIKLFRL
jgi:predicted TIM-barrel fold metal-dependent hydrolase